MENLDHSREDNLNISTEYVKVIETACHTPAANGFEDSDDELWNELLTEGPLDCSSPKKEHSPKTRGLQVNLLENSLASDTENSFIYGKEVSNIMDTVIIYPSVKRARKHQRKKNNLKAVSTAIKKRYMTFSRKKSGV